MKGRLISRLERLEACERAVAAAEPFLLCLYHESEPPGEVIASQSLSGPVVARHPGEALGAFTKRASVALGQQFMLAIYGQHSVGASWLNPPLRPARAIAVDELAQHLASL